MLALQPCLAVAAIVAGLFGGSAFGGVFTGVQYATEPSPQQHAPEQTQPARSLRRRIRRRRGAIIHRRSNRPAAARRWNGGNSRRCGRVRRSCRAIASRRSSAIPPIDPLYEETRPDWDQQHYERPSTYIRSTTGRMRRSPLLGLDPIRRPTADRPLYVLPNDNKPNNNLKFYAAPGYDRPTMPLPVPRGPNYVIQPEFAPAYDHPTYDHPYYDRPEYLGPTYEPPEYAPPQNRAPDYVAPPQ